MTDKLRLYSATVEVDVLYYATSDDPFDAIDAAREALRDCGAEASACPQEVTCEEDALGWDRGALAYGDWPYGHEPPSVGEYLDAHARGGQDAADAMIAERLAQIKEEETA